ncbi:MAG: M12 family metallo-peptidase [Steroidobacteraceae bacterium]
MTAAPAFRILYHEAIQPQVQQVSGHTRNMSFEAYGRHFNFTLQPNEPIRRAIPAGRSDIEPLSGQVEGQPGSWVRLTRTRTGWHGMVSDGQELYAIEPAAEIAAAVVQPLVDTVGSAPVMYRLKDALLPVGPAFCEILNVDGTPYRGSDGISSTNTAAATQGRMTAKTLFDSIVRDTAAAAGPDLELIVGVIGDYEFYQEYSGDPEGTIISRMDIVDGIWSSQVGVKISLAPLTVLTTANEPFTKTVPADLLSQVRSYRSSHPAQKQTGVTHLMTGRDLDGNTVGISYMGSVCDSQYADSVSEGGHSTLMSALIAAHELGHNFNAPHDGEAGACATTPQTFLMAPKVNFNDQFSSCSLEQINAWIKTAQCLTPYEAPDVMVELPVTSIGALANSAFTLSFVAHAIGDDASNDVTALAALPPDMTVQSAVAADGTCTIDGGSSTKGASVTCSLGKLMPQETRRIDLTVVGTTTGSSTATLSVASPNDYVASNNSAQVAIQISPAAAAPTASNTSGSGGGGGSMDLEILAALGGVAGLAVRRRTRLHQESFTL